jgi:hypothetical protein
MGKLDKPRRLIQSIAPQSKGLPPLSSALRDLLSLSAEDQDNVKLLALIASKDPAAVARLQALGSSASLGARRKATRTVEEAIQLIGTHLSVVALCAIWATDAMPLNRQDTLLQGFVRNHIFSCYSTLSRLILYSAMPVNRQDVQMFSIMALLPLSWVLAEAADHPARVKLQECASSQDHNLHQHPELANYLALSVDLADDWKASTQVLAWLKASTSPRVLGAFEPCMPAMLRKTEELLSATAQGREATGLDLVPNCGQSCRVCPSLAKGEVSGTAFVMRFASF